MTLESLSALRGLAEKLVSLHQQAVIALAPQVQDIIASNSQDVVHIEQTLDLLLDSACTTEGLELLKTLALNTEL